MDDYIGTRFNSISSVVGLTVDGVCQLSAVTSNLHNQTWLTLKLKDIY